MSLEDKFACAELIQSWGFYRDQRRWDDLLSTFHPDGEIAVSWFRGPFHEFVEHCKRGGPSKHLIFAPLVLILGNVIYRGITALQWNFFIHMPAPVGETGGGMANAIVGSLLILLVASIIGVPLGVGSGIFLAEYGRNTVGNVVRFTADVLNGIPSIVIGITVYALVVIIQHHFSLLAGGVALGIMMIPTVSRTTEEVLLLVPQSIREAALGLGIPQWRGILQVVLPAARRGLITTALLAIAPRLAGPWYWRMTREPGVCPVVVQNVTKKPTARKAASLTRDSAATATIRPVPISAFAIPPPARPAGFWVMKSRLSAGAPFLATV